MKRPVILLLAALASITPALSRNQPSFDELAHTILDHNPSYRTERVKIEADNQTMKNENNLEDPEVEFTRLWGHNGAGNRYEIGVSQSFDWPGAYAARTNVRKATSTAMCALAESNRLDLLEKIQLYMIDIVNSRKQMALYGCTLAELDSLYTTVKHGVQQKEVSVLDGNKIKIERIAISRKYNEAVRAYNQSCQALAELNGGEECNDVISQLIEYPSTEPLPTLDYFLEKYRSNNPFIAYRTALAEANRKQADAVRKESFPGFSVGLKHLYEDRQRFTGISVGLTLPFFSKRGKSKAVQLESEAIDMESRLLELTGKTKVESDYSQTKLLMEELLEYEDIFNNDESLRLLRKAYEARHITVLEYLAELTYFTDAKSEYLQLLYQYHSQRIALEKYTGTM